VIEERLGREYFDELWEGVIEESFINE